MIVREVFSWAINLRAAMYAVTGINKVASERQYTFETCSNELALCLNEHFEQNQTDAQKEKPART
jgi:hypothetical protein